MPEKNIVQITTVQIDRTTRELLGELAEKDFRSLYSELRWIIREEYARRNIQPADCAELQTEQTTQ